MKLQHISRYEKDPSMVVCVTPYGLVSRRRVTPANPPTHNTPPPPPVFPDLAPQDLVITNKAGIVAVKLVCPADPGNNTVLRASPPQSAGVGICRNFRIIGTCPAPVRGFADITALYTACFGVPAVRRQIFIRVSTMVTGFESLPREFRALVPAS